MPEDPHDPTCLHVYLGYRDVPAQVRWLETVLGFAVHLQADPDEDGNVPHCELVRGGCARVGVYLGVPDPADVDAAHAAAVTAEATTVVWEPARTDWNYRARFRDPEGREWTVGTHVPGAPVERDRS